MLEQNRPRAYDVIVDRYVHISPTDKRLAMVLGAVSLLDHNDRLGSEMDSESVHARIIAYQGDYTPAVFEEAIYGTDTSITSVRIGRLILLTALEICNGSSYGEAVAIARTTVW